MFIVAVGAGVQLLGACSLQDSWTANVPIGKGELAATGRHPYFILEPGYYLDTVTKWLLLKRGNPYFSLEPGYYLVLEGGGEQMTITVLSETKMVDGVETRVVEEREIQGGQLVEVSRDYFAMSKRTNDVFYFGEDVDLYKDGTVVSHEGAWLSGVNGARFGLMMPGQVLLNARYYLERAPGVALDRAEIVSTSETVKTPAGEFTNCVKVKKSSPLEPFITRDKYYAPGIGLVQDGNLKLVRFGRVAAPGP